jgi:hypothetical protein
VKIGLLCGCHIAIVAQNMECLYEPEYAKQHHSLLNEYYSLMKLFYGMQVYTALTTPIGTTTT